MNNSFRNSHLLDANVRWMEQQLRYGKPLDVHAYKLQIIAEETTVNNNTLDLNL